MTESLCFVVCTKDRPESLRNLLRAVAIQSQVPDEVLIVDASTSSSATLEMLKEFDRTINVRHIIPRPEERGLTKQRNLAVRLNRHNQVAFLDDDTIPSRAYFQRLSACLHRHPDAVGVGGYIPSTPWEQIGAAKRGYFVNDGWRRQEALRWRALSHLRLTVEYRAGFMPPSGYHRSNAFPPSGKDYLVENIMGGASLWRRTVFDHAQFPTYLGGYGLYEDLVFCLDAAHAGDIYLCTSAIVEHHHDPRSRPRRFAYGAMVTKNGYLAWRKRWPDPPPGAQLRWWTTSIVLALIRGLDRQHPIQGFIEAVGRFAGLIQVAVHRNQQS